MIRHMLLLRWKSHISPQQIAAAIERAQQLRQLSCIGTLYFGAALDLLPDSYDAALVIDFADTAGWHEYQVDPQHKEYAAFLRPLIASFARIQIDIPTTANSSGSQSNE